MIQKSIADIAENFGLTIEVQAIPDHASAIRVFKGVNPIFVGTEEAVRDFLVTYEKELPKTVIKPARGLKE